MPQKVTTYNVPAAGGVPTVIRCTQTTVEMHIVEDSNANAGVQQGYIYQTLTSQGQPTLASYKVGTAITVNKSISATTPLVITSGPNDHHPHRLPIGTGGSSPNPVCPGGPVTTGTPVLQITSATATPTTVDVTEWD